MFLPATFLLLLFLLTTYPTLSPANPNYTTTTLNFDALPTPSRGLSALPTPLSNIPHLNLTFSSRFSLFTPSSPYLAGFISPRDRNCAVSWPNALVGSREGEGGEGAWFGVDGGEVGFELVGMKVKPMDRPESDVGTNLTIRGWRIGPGTEEGGDGEEEGEVLEWSVVFPYGFWDMFEVKLEAFSGVRWDGLWKVEVGARYGVDGLDWELCVDDLVVGFEGVGEL